ncbi:MAG: glutathione S-transferase family protein [Pseudomonadota bacterium]
MNDYVLHYAPDNASLCVRLMLEEIGLAYRTALVDRAAKGQYAPAYLALNPNGLIPALETPQGVMFETAAILLWLSETHGLMGVRPGSPNRGAFLKWLFFLSNTVHPALRRRFYAVQYIGADKEMQAQLQEVARQELLRIFAILEHAKDLPPPLTVFDCYLCPIIRWAKVYPNKSQNDWFDLGDFPRLSARAEAFEARPALQTVATAEGLGETPFTDPQLPQPPEGSAV